MPKLTLTLELDEKEANVLPYILEALRDDYDVKLEKAKRQGDMRLADNMRRKMRVSDLLRLAAHRAVWGEESAQQWGSIPYHE